MLPWLDVAAFLLFCYIIIILLYRAGILFLANWIVDGTDSSERLIINVCRNISSADADVSCPRSAAVCLISKCRIISIFILRFIKSAVNLLTDVDQ